MRLNPSYTLHYIWWVLCALSRLWFLETLWMMSSSALFSSCRLMSIASFMESVRLMFGLPFFLLPSIFPQHYCIFQRILSLVSWAKFGYIDFSALPFSLTKHSHLAHRDLYQEGNKMTFLIYKCSINCKGLYRYEMILGEQRVVGWP